MACFQLQEYLQSLKLFFHDKLLKNQLESIFVTFLSRNAEVAAKTAVTSLYIAVNFRAQFG